MSRDHLLNTLHSNGWLPRSSISRSTAWAIASVIVRWRRIEPCSTRRLSAPSSLPDIGLDMVGNQVASRHPRSINVEEPAFFFKMAIRVSRSGGCRSAIMPHSKRERKRSSRVAISRGGRSLVKMICALAVVEIVEGMKKLLLCALLPAMNWISSIIKML